MKSNKTIIQYFGQPMAVCCDQQCQKAWGINNRPYIQLSEDEDDIAHLPDDLLGIAPADPGTYEGDIGKPSSPLAFPTKWCVRECERCARSAPGEWDKELEPPSFRHYQFNKPHEVKGL